MYINSNFFRGILIFILVIVPFRLFAQDNINLIVNINAPYSPYLSDYVSFDNKLVVTLINTKAETYNVRLAGSFEGNNGVKISIKNNYIPTSSIKLNPFESKTIYGSQIKEYFEPSALDFAGVTLQEVILGNGLPEGNYDLCLQALDYNQGTPLSMSAPMGCFNFNITHLEPPSILQPICGDSIESSPLQNILFSWSIPAGAQPNKVEYVLTIVEMIPNEINPNQSMNTAGDNPFFSTTIQTNSFLYSAAQPKLIEGRAYAFKVRAKNIGNSKELYFKNNGNSEVCYFVYKSKEVGQNNQQVNQYAGECAILNCAPTVSNQIGNQLYQVGNFVKIGWFNLKLTNLISNTSANLSGEGTVEVPLFRTTLKVTFQNLQVNKNNEVFSGIAEAILDPGAIVENKLKSFQSNLDQLTNQELQGIKNLGDYVKNNSKIIDNFVDISLPQMLPIAWGKLLNANLQLITIPLVQFTAEGAFFNAFQSINVPETNNKTLFFGAQKVCFHPTGLTVDGLQKLTMLGQPVTVPFGNQINLVINPVTNNENGTYVKWGCKGYESLQVDGEFVFSSDLLVNAQGNQDVKAKFLINASTWGDLLGTVNIDPFYVKGMKGIKIESSEVTFDFSDIRNPQNIQFPQNYSGIKDLTWRGLYFKTLNVSFPDYLKKNNNQNINLNISNAIINKTGFTATFNVQPVISVDEGNLGGWAFSINKIEVSILENSMTKGEFNGIIRLPVTDVDFSYKCLLSQTNNDLNTQFNVLSMDEIDVDIFASKMKLFEGSGITVESKNNDVTVKALFNGRIDINRKFPDMKAVEVKMPNIEFQELTITNKAPYVTAKSFKFASPQKFFAGFPVSIKPEKGDGIEFISKEDKIGLKIAFHVGLDDNGANAISGGTSFTLWAKESNKNGKLKYVPDKPELNKIDIFYQGPTVELEGGVELYSNHNVFGDGFRGALSVKIKPMVSAKATVQFGTTKYNSNSNYRYWFVDAMATFNPGIPITAGMAIYGFGGGAYYHMIPQTIPEASKIEGSSTEVKNFNVDNPGGTSSGIVYTPNVNLKFGFKASVVLGTLPKPNAFNGDLTLEASFFEGGGLNEINFSGNCYFFTKNDLPEPGNRPKPGDGLVTASIEYMKYSAVSKAFDGKITVNVNVNAGNKELLKGGGTALMHFSKDKWFIKVGNPQQRFNLKALKVIDASTYFMAGYGKYENVLGSLPDLPNDAPFFLKDKLPAFNNNPANQRKPEVNSGGGFAFGQQMSLDTDQLEFLIFYARLGITFGFDLSVIKSDITCNGNLRGIHGWYGQGNAYAGMNINFGLNIDLAFLKTKVEICDMLAVAAVQAGLPNPMYIKGAFYAEYNVFNGALKGSTDFSFKYGDECDESTGDPFAGLQVISEIAPSGNSASVFSYPEVAFNLPVGPNKPLDIKVYDEAKNSSYIRKIRFGIQSFTVQKVKEKGKAIAPVQLQGNYSFANQNLTAVFNHNEMLSGLSDYKVRVEVFGEEFKNGKWEKIKVNGQVYIQNKELTFTTAAEPSKFVDENIITTRPARMQRYFYYLETANKGYILFKFLPNNIKNAVPDGDNHYYKFVVKFHEVGAGSNVIFETPIEWKNDRIEFALPNQFKPKTIYILQFVRIKTLKPGNVFANNSFGQSTEDVSLGMGQTIQVRKSYIKSVKLNDNEFLLYQLAFKTSKYYSMFSKLDFGYLKNPEGVATVGTGDYKLTISKTFKGDEPFDFYDLNEVAWSKGQFTTEYSPALIQLYSIKYGENLNNIPFADQIYDYYYQFLNWPFYKERLSTSHGFPSGTYPNPFLRRTYPSANAYPPNSRILNNSFLYDMPLPNKSAYIKYSGNGTTWKLTNEEINASFWKGYNPGGMTINQIVNPNNQNQNQNNFNQNVNLKQNEVNKITVTSDLMTVINNDRKLFNKELDYRANLSVSVFKGAHENGQKYAAWSNRNLGNNFKNFTLGTNYTDIIKFLRLGDELNPVNLTLTLGK